MKWLLIIPFLCLTWVCLAQEGIYVPDPALREALQKQGLMKGDTIQIQASRKQLDISKAGIHDLTGIRAFTGLWRLNVFSNELTSLNELPPLLTYLSCQNNKIEVLDFEHPTLKILIAGSNKIKIIRKLPGNLQKLDVIKNPLDSISTLPESLQVLNIANCQFKHLPILPNTLELLNYAANPIDTALLPAIFKACPCQNTQLNCLPSELMKWKIFGLPGQIFAVKEFNKIHNISLKITTANSWGMGSDTIKVDYERKGDLFKTTRAFHKYVGLISPKERLGEGARLDSIWFEREFSAQKLFETLHNLYLPTLQLNNQDFGYEKSIFKIDLSKLPKAARDGQSQYHTCEDCSYYTIDIKFIDAKAITKVIHLQFDSGFRFPQIGDTAIKEFPIQQMLEWLYLYQLSHLFFPDDMTLNKSHFQEKSIESLAEWAKEFFPELNK